MALRLSDVGNNLKKMCQSGRTKIVLEFLTSDAFPHNNRPVPMSVEMNLHPEADDQFSKRTRNVNTFINQLARPVA
jgi:hypothetical protein